MANRSSRTAAIVLLLCLLLVSCGTRRSHEDVVAAAGGGAGTSTATGGTASGGAGGSEVSGPGGVTTGGDVTATGDSTVTGSGGPASGTGGSTGGAAAAPGSDTGGAPTDAGGGGAAASGGGAGAAAGSPIRVGVVGTLSGPAGASLKPIADGVRVWARAVNERGGVNGHPVEVITADDGGDPARHRSLVQEFVEQKKVIAFVGNPEALTGESSVEYLTQAGVPVIGSEAAGQYFYESPVYFPQGSHGDALGQSSGFAVAEVAKAKGLTKVGTITCVEVQVCRDGHAKAKKMYAKYGMEVVYQAQSSIGQPDFTAECLNAQNAGAEVITIGMDANAIRAIAQACSRQGYKPLYSWTAGSTVSAHGTDPNLEGSIITTIVGPWTASDTPGTKEFQDAMAKFAKGVPPAGGHMMGWVSGKVFEAGAKSLPEPPTSKALLDGLGTINGDVMPDLSGPFLFSPGQPAKPTVCGFVVSIAGGGFKTGEGGRRLCTEFDASI